MNVARLLQDSPSDDHRRRQELKEKQDRERDDERDREREENPDRDHGREREREGEIARDRGRGWDPGRERSRDWDREGNSLSSASVAPPPAHRSYSPVESTLPPRSHAHAYDNKQPVLPPPSRSTPSQNHAQNHGYVHPSGSNNMHARSTSQDSHTMSSSHSHSHSPTAPLFLSPLTAPPEGAVAGPLPGTALNSASSEYSAEYPPRAKNAQLQPQGSMHPLHPRLDQDREREYRRRAQSASGSARPRSPPYGDYRDAGRVSPTITRLASKQRSPAPNTYSVVPPPPPSRSQQQQHLSPPLSSSHSNSNSPSQRMHASQGPPLTRRPPLPPSSLPPPPSVSLKYSHDSNGAPTPSAMSRSFDERPYLGRAPSSSSSSAMSMGRERTLKEDIERERKTLVREREREREQRERENERERGTGRQRSGSSRSASAGASTHASPPNTFSDRVGERDGDSMEMQRMQDMDVIRAVAETRMQGQPRDARERDAQRHHHHHHHHHPLMPPQSHSQSHLNQNQQAQRQQQQQHHAQQPIPHIPGTPYTYAHTGKPRISRSGVLKLAPPGVTVSNNVPPSSSDLIFAGATGVVMRQETLTLAPSTHGPGSQQQHDVPGPPGTQPVDQNLVEVKKQLSPPTLTLRISPESPPDGSHGYQEGPVGFPDGPHSQSHPQQHEPPLNKHRSYSVIPTGPGVPPPNGAPPPPPNLHASMMAVQQQQQQQHVQQFASIPPHHQVHHSLSHQQPYPPQSQNQLSSSSNGMHMQGPPHLQTSPYRHMPSGMPPQHQGFPPPPMHYNDVPPPPVPMALQPMPAPSPPMREPTPAEAPVHLGTFVFPRTPFPYFFPARADFDSRAGVSVSNISPGQMKKGVRRESDLSAEQKERPTHVTVLVRSAHLPSSLPTDSRPRIWGGAPLAAPTPWPPYPSFVARLHPRRIYTDDSDIVLCALHSGRVSWNGIRRARAAGLDLSIRLSLHRDVGHFLGGPSSFADGSAVEGATGVDVGLKQRLDGKSARDVSEDGTSWLMAPSASWESGHDGSGIEVIGAEWIPRGSTRKLGLRNRSQRLREYTERRAVVLKEAESDVLDVATVLGKRPSRVFDQPFNSLCKYEEEISATRTVTFGKCREAASAGFKYVPSAVRSVLFPSASSEQPRGRRKRRKLNGTSRSDDAFELYSDGDVDGRGSPLPRRSGKVIANKDIILENNEERFLLSHQDQGEGMDEDKENRVTSAKSVQDLVGLGKRVKGRRYNLCSLPSASSPIASPDRQVPPQITSSMVNGSVGRKSDIQTPMTPESNRSEPSSPQDVIKNLNTEVIVEDLDKSDTRKVEVPPSNGALTKSSGKATVIPTPPATTETLHAPSPPPFSFEVAKKTSELAMAPLILHRDLGAENVEFLEGGLSILAAERSAENGAEKQRKAIFIPVDQWRWAGSRDSDISRSGGSVNIAGLGVAVS